MTNYNTYYKSYYDRLKYKFKGSDSIEQNYSQAFQDLFVLSVLDGKKSGTYVEIGGDHPININNSYLLETYYDWKGISLELNLQKVEYYNSIRKNICICSDATEVDYDELFLDYNLPNFIDYLQVDIEPSWQTLKALKKIPHDKYRFAVITFETDLYKDGSKSSEDCHELLTKYGYELIIKNVANEGFPYENWYVDPNIIGEKTINIFKDVSDTPKEAINCVLKTKELKNE